MNQQEIKRDVDSAEIIVSSKSLENYNDGDETNQTIIQYIFYL
jgi:hypothetical protein